VGGNWPRLPTESSGHNFRLCFWISLGEDSLVRLADRCGRLQLRVPVGGGKRMLGYVRTKYGFGWEILNSVLVVCAPAYRAPVPLVFLRCIV
jgi:hypothetical protein